MTNAITFEAWVVDPNEPSFRRMSLMLDPRTGEPPESIPTYEFPTNRPTGRLQLMGTADGTPLYLWRRRSRIMRRRWRSTRDVRAEAELAAELDAVLGSNGARP